MSDQNNTISVMEKALPILEFLVYHPEGCQLNEITKATKINKSTAHRILQTYKKYNYVIQDNSTGHYRLGSRLLLFSSYINNFDFSSFLLPYMQEFSDATGYSTNLAVLEDYSSVTIETYVPQVNSSIRIEAEKGFRSPLYCTASGKVFLSSFSEQMLNQYFEDIAIKKFTNHTIIDKNLLIKEILEVKTKGFSVEKMENEEHIISLAAPIFDAQKNIKVAIAMMMLSQNVNDDDINRIGNHLKRISLLASQGLGATITYKDNWLIQ